MSESPITVTYSLEEVLKQINQKLDNLDSKIGKQSEDLNKKIDNLDSKIDKVSEDLNKKIDKVSEDLDKKIDKVSEDLNKKIDKVSEDLNKKIDKVSEETNRKIDNVSEKITKFEATLEAQQPLIQKVLDLAEKIGELKNWKQIVIIAVTATIGAIAGWFIRGGKV